MPVKQKPTAHRYPKHYAKVYWPYIPLILIVAAGLWLGAPMVAKSQQGVLAYSTAVSNESLLKSTNSQRVANGDSPLTENQELDQAATAKAKDMVNRNYWSHDTPDGAAPWVFIDQTSYQYHKAGENLAYGFDTSSDVVSGWMNSPPHRANLLDSSFQEVGFGVANSQNYQKTGPETIVVAFYAEPGIHDAGVTASSDSKGAVQSNSTSKPPEHQSVISKAQALTHGQAPWITFALGIVAGSVLAFLVVKHSLQVHRTVRKGEKYIITHPILDITILALVALIAILCQDAGIIR